MGRARGDAQVAAWILEHALHGVAVARCPPARQTTLFFYYMVFLLGAPLVIFFTAQRRYPLTGREEHLQFLRSLPPQRVALWGLFLLSSAAASANLSLRCFVAKPPCLVLLQTFFV